MTGRRDDILWPTAVVGLILLGMVSTFGVLIASRSDGGPAVLDNYYKRAVAWDSTAALRQASLDMKWKTDLLLTTKADGSPRVLLAVTDSTGLPVEGLTGTISFSRPQTAGIREQLTLSRGVDSGTWYVDPSVTGSGLWDVGLELRRGPVLFVHTVRKEWHLP